MNDLDRREVALEALTRRWQDGVRPLIEDKLSAAEAHAVKALTDTLRTTPDGRPTVRKANQSPSYQAALGRLDELLWLLAGRSRASLDGRLRDAAEAFYRAAVEAWKPQIPEELWASPDAAPTLAGLKGARRLVVHGNDVYAELAPQIEQAGRRLLAVLAQAGQRSTPDHIATDLVETWRRQTQAGLTIVVNRILSDWQKATDTIAGRDLVHPDWHDASPLEL